MNTFDLQIQTMASDGKHAPADIIAMARRLGVGVVAITDHDTVAGVGEAASASVGAGVRVIPGIEISVEERGAHLLGYGIDIAHEGLLAALGKAAEDRIGGARQMVENLKAAGFVVEWDDVARQATGAVVARPHIARAILGRPENKAKLGAIATAHDFIEAYLANDNPNYAHRARISARDAIALLHEAGGVAVWSHPAIHFAGDAEGLEGFLDELRGWGIDGMEVFNPSHTEDDAEFLMGLVATYRMLRTAGSDFHEEGPHAADPATGLHSARALADYETYGFATDDIVPRLDEEMNRRRNGQPQP